MPVLIVFLAAVYLLAIYVFLILAKRRTKTAPAPSRPMGQASHPH